MSIEIQYLKVVIERFKSVKNLGDKVIEQLSESDIHWRYNDQSNSIAVIVKHLSGNMVSRWSDFLHSDGEKSNRNRDDEFFDTITSKKEMVKIWEKGWHILFEALNDLKSDDLLKNVNIRGESHLVMEAVERQLAHYAYHIGQIVYVGKQIKGVNWQNLSIPKGESEEYLLRMLKNDESD